ncbi:hypothetical protein V5E97_12505 [Singulisphaera sp. Ch08]|uniref:Uncharacterized protein n=1 Tax=Singulisphaera sp. Ch08 TaxID=3120278 RepID=A0AAU7CP80_9BACT
MLGVLVSVQGREARWNVARRLRTALYHKLMAEGTEQSQALPTRTTSPLLVEILDQLLTYCRDQRVSDTYE